MSIATSSRNHKMAKELTFAPTFSSYRDYQAEAHELVKKLIRASLERIAAEQDANRSKGECEAITWPLGKDFTTEEGLEAINKFVKVRLSILYSKQDQ